jgi:ubiquinone/menaquinone biosynthesis C-methylase UbiE
VTLRDRLSGLYSHLQNRTISVYWRARSPDVLRGLDPRPDDTMLEVGCGAGLWTSYLATRVGRMYALDLDPAVIEAARRWKAPRGPIEPIAGVRFLRASAEALPFRSGAFQRRC